MCTHTCLCNCPWTNSGKWRSSKEPCLSCWERGGGARGLPAWQLLISLHLSSGGEQYVLRPPPEQPGIARPPPMHQPESMQSTAESDRGRNSGPCHSCTNEGKARGPPRRACVDVRACRVEGRRSPTPTSAGPHICTRPTRRASYCVTTGSGNPPHRVCPVRIFAGIPRITISPITKGCP
jgi:hypothetical protein